MSSRPNRTPHQHRTGAMAGAQAGSVHDMAKQGVPLAGVATARADMSTRHAQARQKKGLGRYRKGKKLGQGAFGTVYQGIDQLTGQFVAIKVISVEHLNSDEEVRNEFDLLQMLKHENIVRYIDFEFNEDNTVLRIYLEYVDGGSLASVIKQYGRLSEEVCAVYIVHLLRGLKYLHANGVLHRDIKPANLLVSIDASVKLADFGASKKLEGADGLLESKFVGTPAYIAPESIRGKHTYKSDIWSVGCTLLELVTGKQPWSGAIQYSDVLDFITQIANSEITPKVPRYLSKKLKSFLSRCLQRNPDHRADCAELLQHPFLAKASRDQRCGGVAGDAGSALSTDDDDEEEEYEEYEEFEEEEEEEGSEGGGEGGEELNTMDALFKTTDIDATVNLEEDGLDLGEPAMAAEEVISVRSVDESTEEQSSQQHTRSGGHVRIVEMDSPGSHSIIVSPPAPQHPTPKGALQATESTGASPGHHLKHKSFRIKHVVKSPQFQTLRNGGAKPPPSGWFPSAGSAAASPRGGAEEAGEAGGAEGEEEEEDAFGDLCGLFIAAHHCNDVLATGFFTSFDSRPGEHRRQASADLASVTDELNQTTRTQSHQESLENPRNYLSVTGTPDGLVTIDLTAQKETDPTIPEQLTYKFDVFFNESTTPGVLFERIGTPIIRTLMHGKTLGKKVSITCAGMPYSGKSQTVIGRDNVFQRSQMGFLPLIIQKLYDDYGSTHDFYISSMCCRKEKKGVFDNINHKLIDGVADWDILSKHVLQRSETWEQALADLDLSKLAFLGVKSPHMLVVEARKKGKDTVTGTLFVTLFYGRQWTYWLNGLTFLVHHYFVYTNSLAGSQSQTLSTDGMEGTLHSPDSSKLKAELRRYVSNEFFGIVEQIYKDPFSMNYILHNFHGLVAHLEEISSSLSALGSATRQAPRNMIPGSKEKET